MKKFLLLLCMVVGVVMNGITVNAEEDCITVKITREYKYDEAYKLARMINDYRVENGFNAIPVDAGLMEQAMVRAVEQALLEGHGKADASGRTASCNTYVNGGSFTAENAFNAWKESPGHNAYMLGYATNECRMGVGLVDNSAVLFLHWVAKPSATVLTNKVVTTDVKVAKKYIQSVHGVDCSEDPWLTEATVDTKYDVVGSDNNLRLYLLNEYEEKTWNPYIDWNNFDIYSTDESVLTIDGKIATVQGSGTCKIVYQLRGTDFKSEYEVTINCPNENEEPEKVNITSVSKKRSGKKTAITVKFEKQDDCKYQVQFSTDKSFKKSVKSFNVSNNKKTYTKSFKGKKVYVRVRAYKTVNGKKIYGKWSSKKSVKSYK